MSDIDPVDEALQGGRLQPYRAEHWRRLLVADPEGTIEALAAMPVVVPLVEIGYNNEEGDWPGLDPYAKTPSFEMRCKAPTEGGKPCLESLAKFWAGPATQQTPDISAITGIEHRALPFPVLFKGALTLPNPHGPSHVYKLGGFLETHIRPDDAFTSSCPVHGPVFIHVDMLLEKIASTRRTLLVNPYDGKIGYPGQQPHD